MIVHLYTEDPNTNHDAIARYFDVLGQPIDLKVNQYDTETTSGILVVFGLTTKPIQTKIPRQNRLLILSECTSIRNYENNYMEQFGKVIGAHDSIPERDRICPGHGFFYEESTDFLQRLAPPTKNKLISIISSNKTITRGHKHRLDFCKQLALELKCEQHFFGRGINDFNTKWDVFRDYKYTVAIENSTENHWITEKLTEPMIAYCFPIYHGAPNVGEYYPKDSLQKIDINDFNSTLKTIENLLSSEAHYEESVPALIEARSLFFGQYLFVHHIKRFYNSRTSGHYGKKSEIVHPHPGNTLPRRLKRKLLSILALKS